MTSACDQRYQLSTMTAMRLAGTGAPPDGTAAAASATAARTATPQRVTLPTMGLEYAEAARLPYHLRTRMTRLAVPALLVPPATA
jgi:hypothetical protein